MVRTQEQVRHRHRRHRHYAPEETWIEPAEHGSAAADLKHDLDDLLDEIDSALEQNAEGS